MPDHRPRNPGIQADQPVREKDFRQLSGELGRKHPGLKQLVINHGQMLVDMSRRDLLHRKLLHRLAVSLIYPRLSLPVRDDIDEKDRALRIGELRIVLEIHLDHLRHGPDLSGIQRHQIRLIEPGQPDPVCDPLLIPAVILRRILLPLDQIGADDAKHGVLRAHAHTFLQDPEHKRIKTLKLRHDMHDLQRDIAGDRPLFSRPVQHLALKRPHLSQQIRILPDQIIRLQVQIRALMPHSDPLL